MPTIESNLIFVYKELVCEFHYVSTESTVELEKKMTQEKSMILNVQISGKPEILVALG